VTVRAGVGLILAAVLLLGACTSPRPHARVRVTPSGVKVVPSLSTSIAGIGVSVTQ